MKFVPLKLSFKGKMPELIDEAQLIQSLIHKEESNDKGVRIKKNPR